MKKKRITLIIMFFLFFACAQKNKNEEEIRPNFILINIDDLGYSEIEPFGSKENLTPNLSKLAQEGTILTSFYSACSVCSPSRAALLTGSYPQRVGLGMGSNNEVVLFPGDSIGINSEEITLAEHLQSSGYSTACIGKWHLGDQSEFLPQKHGFDYYFGIPYSNDMWIPNKNRIYPPLPLLRNSNVVDTINSEKKQSFLCKQFTYEAISFIERNKSKPFFLYLPHSFIHGPHIPRKNFSKKSINPNKNKGGTISEIDHSVGRIMVALEEFGLEDNTLIWFISDNGGTGNTSNLPLKGRKGSYWEGGFRVPGIVHWPGNIPEGRRIDKMVSSMDIYPTLASLAGTTVSTKQVVDGLDMSELIIGKTNKSPRYLLYYYVRNELSAIRYREWKLLFDGQLFNLSNDISETTDVSKQHPKVVAEMGKYFENARKQLGDARLGVKGEECRPSGRKLSNLSFIIPGKDIDGEVKDYWIVKRLKR